VKKVFIGLIVLLTLMLAISVAAEPVEPDIGAGAQALTALQVVEHPAAVVTSVDVAPRMADVALDERHSIATGERIGNGHDYGLMVRKTLITASPSAARSSPEARCRAV
jgi:trans-aconitate methyltransferase